MYLHTTSMILVKPMKINRENRVYKLSKSFKFNDPFVDDHYKKALVFTQNRKQIPLSKQFFPPFSPGGLTPRL